MVESEKCDSGLSLDKILVRTANVRSMMLKKYNKLVHDGSSDDDRAAKRLEAATAVEHDLYGKGDSIERPKLVPYVLLLWKRLDYSKESVLNDVIRRIKTLYELPCPPVNLTRLVQSEKCESDVSLELFLERLDTVLDMMLDKYNALVDDAIVSDDELDDDKRLEAATAVHHDLHGYRNEIKQPQLLPYASLLVLNHIDYRDDDVVNDLKEKIMVRYNNLKCTRPTRKQKADNLEHESPETDTLPERSVSHLVNSGMSAKQADDLVRKPMKMAWLKGGGAAGRWAAIAALAGTTLVAGFLHP